jgi:acetyltransferase-like isoleucine patch superfamily enzyme
MEVGKHTYGHKNIKVIWENSAELTIGSFCSFADNIKIYLGGNHRTDWITTYPFGHINKYVFEHDGNGHPATRGNVTIGNDVWIGSNVTIMSGVTIGSGAVIGANSHVISNVKPYAVVGGNPAQLFYFRFSNEVIKKLLKLKWWDLSDKEINKIIPLLCSNNIDWL